jgi:L-arabinose isomerase
MEAPEVWFLTGSQSLYGQGTLDQVAQQSRALAEQLDARPEIPARVVWRPVLTTADAILTTLRSANSSPNTVGVIAWMHTFSPAKMWIAGLDALAKPLLHLHTQANVELPWAEIDMDFMNLNQAAHGDREFGYIQARLGVARKKDGGGPRIRSPRHRADRRMGTGRPGQRRTSNAPPGSVRRQYARRRGDRGRQGGSPATLRGLRQHPRRHRSG